MLHKLAHKTEAYAVAYEHPGCHRTSNAVDRPMNRLCRLLYAGRGPDEVVAARPTAEFDAEMGPPDEFVRRAFESLWAYLSPDA